MLQFKQIDSIVKRYIYVKYKAFGQKRTHQLFELKPVQFFSKLLYIIEMTLAILHDIHLQLELVA